MTLLRSAGIVLALMAILFGGYLAISEAGPSVRERLETPDRLEELQATSDQHTMTIAAGHADTVAHSARQQALRLRMHRMRRDWEDDLDRELQAIEESTQDQIARMEQSLRDSQQAMRESADRLESTYCDSWNPINWMTCRAVRQRADQMQERARAQRDAVEASADRLEQHAREEAAQFRQRAEDRLQEQTAEFEEQLQASLEAMDELEAQRRELEREIDRIHEEEAMLRAQNWLWIEFRDRWPHLLLVSLLIFAAPYMRRTLWYYAGMPLVSRARPIELRRSKATDDCRDLHCGESHRTLDIEVPAGKRILARPGYIQSDRQGAKSELFFDRNAPNLSYISGLVLLTHLKSHPADEQPRQVMIGTPDDPDAYLMAIELDDHPGLVLKARHVVAVMGDIEIDSTWQLSNLHAWATSQVRFIVFSGTGTLILEGYGDIHGRQLNQDREQKRMSRVVGFDTRLSYKTERTATFLPYLIDPGREPLVVDVFEGSGTIFFEKNPSARKRHRSPGEAIAGFFLDAFRRLLGL